MGKQALVPFVREDNKLYVAVPFGFPLQPEVQAQVLGFVWRVWLHTPAFTTRFE